MLHVLPFARDTKDTNDLVDPKAPEAATRNKKTFPFAIQEGMFYNLKAFHFILPGQGNKGHPP